MKQPIFRVIETPFVTVVFIDAARLEREVLKRNIADGDVQKLLPFQTRLVFGEHHTHIANASAYTVETNYHLIDEGDTLCAKVGPTYLAPLSVTPTCAGCLAKGKNIIVNHLLNLEREKQAIADAVDARADELTDKVLKQFMRENL